MKKIILTLTALFVALSFVWAVPADPTSYKYTQPDGTVIVLQNHGDEFFHWTTDVNGNMVEKGADGFYRPSSKSFSAMAAEGTRLRAQQNRSWSSYEEHRATNFGDKRVLCIIANFTDSTFVVENPNEHFSNMLNQEGYSFNGAIGSVRDYYLVNSANQYRPTFDVFGPVNLTHSSKYYDDNGVDLAIMEAYEQLAEQIGDMEQYSTNGTDIDMVLFYYPGHNEAEGAGTESIWPHQGTGDYGTMGGKNLVRYFCTSELRGVQGSDPAAIGTTCHEFAHSLGLPDFYDTDYAQNGQAPWTTDYFDLMSSGSYKDNGRRPPYLSVVERNMLGWAPAPTLLTTSAEYSLNPVQASTAIKNEGYRLDTSNPGEYFILEYRNGEKWDSGIPSGLLLYQVDCSDNVISGIYTAEYLWENTNKINAFGAHPCYWLVPQIASPEYVSDLVFPGRGNVTEFTPTDWAGNNAGVQLSSIAHDGTQSTFTASFGNKVVFGYVTDKNGVALSGVRMTLSQSAYPFAAVPALLSTDKTTTTDEEGYYSFELGAGDTDYQIVTAQKEGYVTMSRNVTASTLFSRTDFVLLAPGDGGYATLQKYDSHKSMTFSNISSESYAVGFSYTADELAEMKVGGSLLKSVTFLSVASKSDFEKVYVIVDSYIGEEHTRLLEKDITDTYVENAFNTIDVTANHIAIPDGADIVIGYGFTGYDYTNGYKYPFAIAGPDDDQTYGNRVMYDFLNTSLWGTTSWGPAVYYSFVVSAQLDLVSSVDFSTYGVSFIQLSSAGVPTVVPASGKTVKGIDWSIDGTPVDGAPSAVSALSAGSHTYMARIRYYDGTAERIYYDVEVE